MTESVGNVEYVGIGKPEPVESAREHPAVKAVKGVLAGWWERVGPGSVEHAFVDAHKNILKHINGEERQKAFEKSAEGWRRTGKIVGIASTVVDFSIGGLGLVVMGKLLLNPVKSDSDISDINKFLAGKVSPFYAHWFDRILVKNTPVLDLNNLSDEQKEHLKTNAFRMVNVLEDVGAYALGGVSAGIALGAGPAHMMGGLGAKVVEFFGTAGVHGGNYVASGKASEHAKKVGGALGKGATAAVTYAAEHPEEIRKTMRTVEDIRKDRERERVAQDLRRKREAEVQLQREYDLWKNSLTPTIRSYYEQAKQWPPPMADFMRERDAFLRDIQTRVTQNRKT